MFIVLFVCILLMTFFCVLILHPKEAIDMLQKFCVLMLCLGVSFTYGDGFYWSVGDEGACTKDFCLCIPKVQQSVAKYGFCLTFDETMPCVPAQNPEACAASDMYEPNQKACLAEYYLAHDAISDIPFQVALDKSAKSHCTAVCNAYGGGCMLVTRTQKQKHRFY